MTDSLRAFFGETWLGLNRMLTVQTLAWRLRGRSCERTHEPEPDSMLYVAASALPYHTSGYTVRTHEIICALQSAGITVHALTRSGYPWDRKDRQRDAVGEETMFGGVLYSHAPHPSNAWSTLFYALKAASVVAQVAARRRVAVIHAASNHVNALPALLAARYLGLPFHYEMRGLWELTRVSRNPGYENSELYKQGLALEGLVARHADRLFVISEQLGSYVRNHYGVSPDRMTLLPNCVDPDRFAPMNAQESESRMIGYAGSLIGYEGLDTLIEAIALLAKRGQFVTANIIGDGEARADLEAQAQRLGVADRVLFSGKMSPEAAREALGRCGLVCLPRKPFRVCEIVPPIKLVEALAMGKPVIVPDLPVFRDELGHDPAGWFFRSGDSVDLARVLEHALADRVRLASFGARAREYAVAQRNWRDFVVTMRQAAQR